MDRYNHLMTLKIDDCIGCTRCMRACPTEAIRIVNGKATLLEEKCIDCGACLLNCHVQAFSIEGDDHNSLKHYRWNIVILPIAIYGMIKELEDLKIIYQTLYDFGFDVVFDSSVMYELLGNQIETYLHLHDQNKPYILTHCPSVVKLIQLNYPSLNDKLLPFDFPFEVGAKIIRKYYAKQLNLDPSEIGISYLAECVANYMEIKHPIGKESSNVDLVFLLSSIFKPILQHIHSDPLLEHKPNSSIKGVLWAKVGGMRKVTNVIDCLSVDGMKQVIEILEKVELGQLDYVQVLEAYACIGGCVGGSFTLENAFVAKSKINRLVSRIDVTQLETYSWIDEILSDRDWIFESELENIEVTKLDDDFFISLMKLRRINEIYESLPKIDCCACGSPSCRALAEDVVAGLKQLNHCVILNQIKRGETFDSE